jgi:hypothetical protein
VLAAWPLEIPQDWLERVNRYLACEAIGAGTCAVAAYHQELMDRLLRVDGTDEFTIYLAPVGKV